MNNNVEIKSGKEARELVLNGAKKLNSAVGSTLGPMGRNVIIEHINYAIPQVTKDGVTVAKKINLANKYENIGCQLVKQASIKTAISAGDGTTSSVVLATSIMSKVDEVLNDKSIGVHQLRREIEVGKDKLIEKLKEISIPVENNDQIFSIASISANNDDKIGKLISDAYKKIGKNGVITVEPSNTTTTSIEIVEGLKFEKGWFSHYFVNNKSKLTCELEDCAVFITDMQITGGNDMLSVLRKALNFRKNLLIIGENISGDAMQTLVANNGKQINVCIVNPPYYGSRRREYLDDLSFLLKCKPLYSDHPNSSINEIHQGSFGFCQKVIVSKDDTIMNGYNNFNNLSKEDYEEKTKELSSFAESTHDQEEKDWISKRIAVISSGVAVIKLGGNSETEVYETKDRLDDALSAVRSSLEEGIVPGGGSTFIKLSCILSDDIVGERILKESLSSVLFKICDNAGYTKEMPYFIKDMIEKSENNYGYDVKNDKPVHDLVSYGIIDPSKVIRNCIDNAVSVSSMFAITDYAIITIEDDII